MRPDRAEECCLSVCAGANGLFSQCIQQAGYGFTSPGRSFYHWDAKSFDPGPLGSQTLIQAFHNASLGSADEVSRVNFLPYCYRSAAHALYTRCLYFASACCCTDLQRQTDKHWLLTCLLQSSEMVSAKHNVCTSSQW